MRSTKRHMCGMEIIRYDMEWYDMTDDGCSRDTHRGCSVRALRERGGERQGPDVTFAKVKFKRKLRNKCDDWVNHCSNCRSTITTATTTTCCCCQLTFACSASTLPCEPQTTNRFPLNLIYNLLIRAMTHAMHVVFRTVPFQHILNHDTWNASSSLPSAPPPLFQHLQFCQCEVEPLSLVQLVDLSP